MSSLLCPSKPSGRNLLHSHVLNHSSKVWIRNSCGRSRGAGGVTSANHSSALTCFSNCNQSAKMSTSVWSEYGQLSGGFLPCSYIGEVPTRQLGKNLLLEEVCSFISDLLLLPIHHVVSPRQQVTVPSSLSNAEQWDGGVVGIHGVGVGGISTGGGDGAGAGSIGVRSWVSREAGLPLGLLWFGSPLLFSVRLGSCQPNMNGLFRMGPLCSAVSQTVAVLRPLLNHVVEHDLHQWHRFTRILMLVYQLASSGLTLPSNFWVILEQLPAYDFTLEGRSCGSSTISHCQPGHAFQAGVVLVRVAHH